MLYIDGMIIKQNHNRSFIDVPYQIWNECARKAGLRCGADLIRPSKREESHLLVAT